MRPRPLFLAALLSAAGLALWQPWRPDAPSGEAAAQREPTEVPPRPAQGMPELPRPGVDGSAAATAEVAKAPAANAAPDRRAVARASRSDTRLILVHATGGRPLGGFRIHVSQGRVSESVLTSTAGVAHLSDSFASGAVDVELRDADRPDLRSEDYTLDRARFGLLTNMDHHLVARPVPWRLEVQLLTAEGAPTKGGRVRVGLDDSQFGAWPRDAQWKEEQRVVGANEEGLATAALTATERGSRLLLAAHGLEAADQVHVPVELEPPIAAGPHELRFTPAATLRVRVLDTAGDPVEGASVRLTSGWPTWAVANERATTDADGHAVFVDLVPGDWRVDWIRAPGSSLEWRPESVVLVSGSETFAELRAFEGLPSDLLAAGRVLSHDGVPLTGCEITAFDARGRVSTTATNAEGAFVLRGEARAGQIELVGRKRNSTAFLEDMPLRVETGSTGLELRAPDPAELCRVRFRVFDGSTGEWNDGRPGVVSFALDAPWSGRASLLARGGSGGSTGFLVHPSNRLLWRIRQHGYRDATGTLSRLPEGGDHEIEVRFMPGLAFRVRVVDRETYAPIAGARFELERDQVLGTTDAQGWAFLEWDAWSQSSRNNWEPYSANLSVLHPDYAATAVQVEDHLFEKDAIWLDDGVVRMTPLQGR